MAVTEQYEVVIARYGTREGRRSEVFLNYPIYRQEDAPITMDYFVWVIRNANRTILVDSGFSPAGGAARGRTTLHRPPQIWRELGIDPEAPQTIIVTHAHYDHIGNLDALADPRVVMAAAELDFWLSPLAERAQFHHSVEDAELVTLRRLRDEGRITVFTDELELAPGIRLHTVGGHTPGQVMVSVDTADGRVLLASDAVHYLEELDDDLPFAFVADLPAMYRGFDRIHALLRDGDVEHVVPGHDPGTLARFRPLAVPNLEQDLAAIGAAVTEGRIT